MRECATVCYVIVYAHSFVSVSLHISVNESRNLNGQSHTVARESCQVALSEGVLTALESAPADDSVTELADGASLSLV